MKRPTITARRKPRPDVKATFSPQIIGQLRSRAAAHAAAGGEPIKLGTMKHLYKRWFNGAEPHAHALAMIDGYLLTLADPLQKGRKPFESQRHPRRRNGRFTGTGTPRDRNLGAGSGGHSGGGGPPPPSSPSGEDGGGQRRFFGDVASRREHRGLADENAGYEAFQSNVIPETRYSTFGPPIAGAVGLASGALTGATATFKPNAYDRLTSKLLGLGGATGGMLIGQVPAGAIRGARLAARGGIGAINRNFGTTYRRPGPAAWQNAIEAAENAPIRAGRKLGHVVGHVAAVVAQAPAALTRRGIEAAIPGARGRVAGRVAGMIVGTAFPGAALLAPSYMHTASVVGPYADAAFPRRVRKQLGWLYDAPEVLAKQAELLGLAGDDLAKADYGEAARRLALALHPRQLAAQLNPREVFARLRSLPADLKASLREPPANEGPPHVPTPAQHAAQSAFAEKLKHFQIGKPRGDRLGRQIGHRFMGGYPIAHAAGLGIAGAGLGGLAGFALDQFAQEHPRDERGRFTRASRARQGALAGAATGALVGLGTGLAAARGGRTKLIRDALARLQGKEAVEGVQLPTAMRTKAVETAKRAHAMAWMDANAKKEKIPPFGTAEGGEEKHIAKALADNAVRRWMIEKGQAIGAGARAWYKLQLDNAFDRAARAELRKFGDVPLKSGTLAQRDLFDRVDVEALNEKQARIWDGLTGKRQRVLDDIEEAYAERAKVAGEIKADIGLGQAEAARLEDQIKRVPVRWDDLQDRARMAAIEGARAKPVSLKELKDFAKQNINHDLQAKTVNEAVQEVDDAVIVWAGEAQTKLNKLNEDLKPGGALEQMAEYHDKQLTADLGQNETERGALKNPFSTGKDRYFQNRPAGADTVAGFQAIKERIGAAAAKPFIQANEQAASEADVYLKHLIGLHEAALKGAIPEQGALARHFRRAAPVLAGHLVQAVDDTVALMAARRASLTGFQKKVSDWLWLHRDPVEAWKSIKLLAGSAQEQAKRGGKWALRNWKPLSTAVGAAGAIGAIDLQQPSGKRVVLNPKKWRMPKGIGIMTEWPNPIKKPHEALVGLNYRGPDGKQKVLWGVHMYGPNAEKDHDILPFGADLEAVRGDMRGGGGASGRAKDIQVERPKELADAIDKLKRGGHIGQTGPAGFEFDQRHGGQGGAPQKDAVDGFVKDHNLKFLAERAPGRTTDKRGRYFDSLIQLFEAPNSAIFDRDTRVSLLIGGSGVPRGVFANRNGIYRAPDRADRDKVLDELKRQIGDHKPIDAAEYTALRRALWIVGEHYGITAAQQGGLTRALNEAYPHKTPPASAAVTAAMNPRIGAYGTIDDYVDAFLADPTTKVPDYLSSPREIRDALKSRYTAGIREARDAGINDPERQHEYALERVDRFAEQNYKAAPDGELRKGVPGQPRQPAQPGQPRRQGPRQPGPPPIGGAAQMPAVVNSGVPAISGAGSGGSVGGDIRAAVKPAHALSQLGIYGLSEAGWNAAGQLATHLLPGGGALSSLGRFGVRALGGVAGAVGGGAAGTAAGHALGDHSRPAAEPGLGESLARGVSGLAGQVGGSAAAQPLASAAGQAVSRGVGAAIGRFTAAQGAEAGGAAGAELGSIAGPIGTAVGGAVGVAGGALAGYLADEGVGILYRHLSRYGDHIPQMAAQTLGHAPS